MIVTDTNIIAYLFLPGEHTRDAEALYAQDHSWAAPVLWRSEFRNVLALHLRKGLLELVDALAIQEEAEAMFLGREYDIPSAEVLSLAQESGCSAYDCEFVALARQLNVPLVTEDRQVLKVFPDVAKSLSCS